MSMNGTNDASDGTKGHPCVKNSREISDAGSLDLPDTGKGGKIDKDSAKDVKTSIGASGHQKAELRYVKKHKSVKMHADTRSKNGRGQKSDNSNTISHANNSKPLDILPEKYRPTKISMDGITLEMMVNKLVEIFGWEELAKNIKINCLSNDPSIKSTLNFLRKTPWARNKVELFYLKFRKAQLKRLEKLEKSKTTKTTKATKTNETNETSEKKLLHES
ncbi:MAG: VF530 family protein [Candidatus Ozemobacteraceae bacterium]